MRVLRPWTWNIPRRLQRHRPFRPLVSGPTTRALPVAASVGLGGMLAPEQYRLELIGGITGTELDVLVASGFVDHAVFESDAEGVWHQTTLESDESHLTAGGDR